MPVKYLKHEDEKCIGCGACEEACAKAFFKEEDRSKSRIKVEEDGSINACNQCGECIKVCPEEALHKNSAGVVMLDGNKCIGCLMCVGFCPSLAMRFHKDAPAPFKCTACGICVKSCPTETLTVFKED